MVESSKSAYNPEDDAYDDKGRVGFRKDKIENGDVFFRKYGNYYVVPQQHTTEHERDFARNAAKRAEQLEKNEEYLKTLGF